MADDRLSRSLCFVLRRGRSARHQDQPSTDQYRRGFPRRHPHESRHPRSRALRSRSPTMAERLKPVDVVTIGVGLTGSLMALELAKTGLKVVGIERVAPRFTVPDCQSPASHDELRFSIRKGMMQDNMKEAVTFRNSSGESALPIRRWGSFLPRTGLGGS